MQLTGEREFEETADGVLEVVFQPDVLEACIPGAESIERVSETKYSGTITRGLASIVVTMEIEVEIIEDERPETVVCAIEGSDNRTNSTADGELTVNTAEADGVTTLSYEADINFTGRLASLGGRLIKRQMKNDLEQFFSNLEVEVEDRESE